MIQPEVLIVALGMGGSIFLAFWLGMKAGKWNAERAWLKEEMEFLDKEEI